MSLKMRKSYCEASQQAKKREREFILCIKRKQPLQHKGFAQGHHTAFIKEDSLVWLVRGFIPETLLSQPDFSNLSGHRKYTPQSQPLLDILQICHFWFRSALGLCFTMRTVVAIQYLCCCSYWLCLCLKQPRECSLCLGSSIPSKTK